MKTGQAMDDRLSKIFAAVVPGEEQILARVVASSDPDQVGKTTRGPEFYQLYLVNESNYDITKFRLRAGGFAHVDEDPFDLGCSLIEFGALKRNAASSLEKLHAGLLDFVLTYELQLTFSDGGQLEAWFDIGKAYALREEIFHFCSVLNQKAYRFSLTPKNSLPDNESVGATQ